MRPPSTTCPIGGVLVHSYLFFVKPPIITNKTRFGSAIAKGSIAKAAMSDNGNHKRPTNSAIASRITSRPTSSSGLLSRPSRAAVSNFCSYMHRHQTCYLYCTLIYDVHHCHTNLWKMLTLTRSLTLTLILTVTVSKNRNFNIKHKIVLHDTWNCCPLVNVNVKRNDVSVYVNFCYGGPSLWRTFAIVAHYQMPLYPKPLHESS